jgi:nitrate/nitrite transporter NarK
MAVKEQTSWDILREPNRILYEDDYKSWLELLIYFLTWGVEIGLLFVFALTYLRR